VSDVGSLLAEVGLAEVPTDRVVIEGADPVLASRFPVGEAAATVLGGCGAVASALFGVDEQVRVEVRRAAASLVGFALLRVGRDRLALEPAEPALVALYECGDGRWVHLHGAFDHLASGTRRVLDLADEDAADGVAVARAVGRFGAQALEDRLAEAGMCGAMVRSAAEWGTHPQGALMATLPRVEIERIGDAPPEPLPAGRAAPLAGVRVLDLTRVLAGPAAGRTLASHGAEVLLINASRLPNVLPFVVDTSHGKRSAFLDLDVVTDATRLRELVRGADVFVNGYRSGTLERRGLAPHDLASLRRGIVYASVNCYGHVGPWVDRPGWEQLAQSVTGLANEQGTPARPELIPAAACDYTTGYLTALGVMAALYRRAREGGSWHVRTSLVQTAMWFQRLGARCDSAAASGIGDPSAFTVVSETPFGPVRHLPPVVEMAAAPPRWDLPTVPLGTHSAEWSHN
jgi:crotonobetainyl-CoA:carnitine CoA-transferase CaiB-like acyl-CoA transferase